MRRLLPEPAAPVDPYDAYRTEDPSAALVRLNMIAAADGSIVGPDGRAGTLGGEGDREVFRTLRALADAILVGAGTVRIEGYGPHRLRPDLAGRRRADGRDAPAAIVVVTASLELDFDAPLFTQAVTPTIVMTPGAADPARRRAAEQAGRVVVAGDVDVDLVQGLSALRDLGYPHVLCEGGPTLNGALLSASLVDELCLTLAPTLVGRRAELALGMQLPQDLELRSVLEHDGELHLRYRIRPPQPATASAQ